MAERDKNRRDEEADLKRREYRDGARATEERSHAL